MKDILQTLINKEVIISTKEGGEVFFIRQWDNLSDLNKEQYQFQRHAYIIKEVSQNYIKAIKSRIAIAGSAGIGNEITPPGTVRYFAIGYVSFIEI